MRLPSMSAHSGRRAARRPAALEQATGVFGKLAHGSTLPSCGMTRGYACGGLAGQGFQQDGILALAAARLAR
jgi:hypothetical protein